MSADRRSFERLRDHARQARETGDYPQAARLERQATELAGALGLPGQQARALLWEGWPATGWRDDLALATLLQVVGERAATADPTDAFGALTTIVHIGLERKPLRFCRALLDQARHYLNGSASHGPRHWIIWKANWPAPGRIHRRLGLAFPRLGRLAR